VSSCCRTELTFAPVRFHVASDDVESPDGEPSLTWLVNETVSPVAAAQSRQEDPVQAGQPECRALGPGQGLGQ